ncbi:DNRLRE domain-containing protein [Paenibacillus sp. UNC499MF]|uniref:DNRLRE domain-containing protein n=1 Tax=Paenibacillus sp. UNC499MF TaxID=1502751 RepID=UPI0008A09AD6|nr:DNRLRE domain-containing protein [Paenibacillus sp. UNC499MF]SEF95026.1 TGF-beta propeptide [Paenibacillus sp. UNC499MF]
MFVIKETTQADFQSGSLDQGLVVTPSGELKLANTNNVSNVALNKPYTQSSDGKLYDNDVGGRMLTDGNITSSYSYNDMTYVEMIVDLLQTVPLSAIKLYGSVASAVSPKVMDVSTSLDGKTYTYQGTYGDPKAWVIMLDGEFSSTDARYVKIKVYNVPTFKYTVRITECQIFAGREYKAVREKEYDLASLKSFNGALLYWGEYKPLNTDIVVEASYSFDNGASWSAYEQIENGNAIKGIPIGMDLSQTKIKIKQTLSTRGVQSPKLFDFRIYFNDYPLGSGYIGIPHYKTDFISVIPPMSSNTSPLPYSVQSLSFDKTSNTYHLFDGSIVNAAANRYMYNGKTDKITMDVGQDNSFKLAAYKMILLNNSSGPSLWSLEASSDSDTWIEIDRQTENWKTSTVKTCLITHPFKGNYRFYRINILDSLYQNSNYIAEMQLFAEKDGIGHQLPGQIYVRPQNDLQSSITINSNHIVLSPIGYTDVSIIPPMSSYTAPKPFEITASSDSPDSPAYMAFNGSPAVTARESWSVTSPDGLGWIQVFTGYQNRYVVNRYMITAGPKTINHYSPKSWTLQASNNGQDWVTLDTRTNETNWTYPSGKNEYLVNNMTAYEYYRFNFLETVYSGAALNIGEIALTPNVTLKAVQAYSTLTVPIRSQVTGTIHVPPHNRLVGKVDITPVLHADMPSTIQARLHDSLSGSIQVPVHNRMFGILDIIPPPVKKAVLLAVQDAFVREGVPKLNYGSEQDMFAGYNAGLNERYRSLVRFDLTALPPLQKLTKADLKIFSDYENMPEAIIGLYEAQEPWTEDGITWDNQPVSASLQLQEKAGKTKGYIKFDLLELVKKWYQAPSSNYGLLLKALDETIAYQRFYTREQGKTPPLLEIEYLDQNVYSPGRSELRNNTLTVRQNGTKNLTGKISVREVWFKSDLPGRIHVHSPDFMECTLFVKSEVVWGRLTVRRNAESLQTSRLTVRVKGDLTMPSTLRVSQPSFPGTIWVRRNEVKDLPASLTARRNELSPLPGSVRISLPALPGSLEVVLGSVVSGTLKVSRKEQSQLSGRLTARQNVSEGLSSYVRVYTKSELGGSILVSSEYFACLITVPKPEIKELRTFIQVRTKLASDLTSRIQVYDDSDDSSYVFIM